MLQYFIKRLFALVPKLFIITVIVFIGLEFIPGDPISYRFPPDMIAKLDPALIEKYRESLGLNQPFYVRYGKWIAGIFRGDLGYSLVNGVSIAKMLSTRLPATMELALFGVTTASLIGIFMGLIAAIKQNSPLDHAFTVMSVLGISVPEFFFGLFGILIFALTLKWLPTGGRMTAGKEAFFQRLPYIVMPAFFLGIGLIATLMRYTRGSMLDVISKDFVKTARSKGIAERKVYINHAFRNALMPVIMVLCFRLPMFFGGTVIIESVFNYPGMGKMMLTALSGNDYPVVMIVTLISASATLFASFLLDLFAVLLDPRIRVT